MTTAGMIALIQTATLPDVLLYWCANHLEIHPPNHQLHPLAWILQRSSSVRPRTWSSMTGLKGETRVHPHSFNKQFNLTGFVPIWNSSPNFFLFQLQYLSCIYVKKIIFRWVLFNCTFPPCFSFLLWSQTDLKLTAVRRALNGVWLVAASPVMGTQENMHALLAVVWNKTHGIHTIND